MYCKYCGSKIDDDAVFCSKCGKKLSPKSEYGTQTQSSSSSSSYDDEYEERGGNGCWLFFVCSIIFVLGVAFVLYMASAASGGQVKLKPLTRDDYSYTTDQGLTTYQVTIYAETNIKTCDVELKLYNNAGDVIYVNTISKSNLKKGKSYTYVFDFGVADALSGSRVSLDITGERESLFG